MNSTRTLHPMSVNTNTIVRWEVLEKMLPSKQIYINGKRVLDVGAGLGFFSHKFKRLGGEVLSTDVDHDALSFIKETLGIQTLPWDIEKDSTLTTQFDLIFMGEILEHIKDPSKVFERVSRLLRPGGYLIISTPALEGVFIHSKGKQLCHHEGSEKHERDGFFKAELTSLFEQYGLSVIDHSYCLYFLSELFMQLTKLGYTRVGDTYHSQRDIASITDSLSYKFLKVVFPALNFGFKIEQKFGSILNLPGHCHIMIARKPTAPS